MPQEQEQKKTPEEGRRRRSDDDAGQVQSASKAAELKEEMDEILDEIDSVLEENAEEFVKSYVQKGGRVTDDVAGCPRSRAAALRREPQLRRPAPRARARTLRTARRCFAGRGAAQCPHGTTVLGLKYADGDADGGRPAGDRGVLDRRRRRCGRCSPPTTTRPSPSRVRPARRSRS